MRLRRDEPQLPPRRAVRADDRPRRGDGVRPRVHSDRPWSSSKVAGSSPPATGGRRVTVSPDRQPIVVSDLDEAIAAVRRSGLRLTSARRLVLEALLAARAPISAEEIADGLGGRMTQSDI